MVQVKNIVIGAGEVAALFGAHPYMTAFELWCTKSKLAPKRKFADTESSFWGNELEEGIGRGYCKLHGLEFIKRDQRFTIAPDMPEMVANLDFECRQEGGAVEILECKLTDYRGLRDQFAGGAAIPMYIELQAQQQMHCTGNMRARVVVLVNGTEHLHFIREYRPDVVEKLKAGIKSFLDMVKRGVAPQPDFERDSAVISRMLKITDGKTINAKGNNYLTNLCIEYLEASAKESAAKQEKKAKRSEILLEIGAAYEVILDRHIITAGTADEAEISYTRQPHRKLNIKEI
jgi:predicted phage-related endonuclease